MDKGRFRRRETETEAVRWDGTQETADALGMHAIGLGASHVDGKSARLLVPTANGETYADVGDWILKDSAGHSYPMKARIFEAQYERI